MKKETILKYVLFPLVIFVSWLSIARYTFNEKPDLNGDNFCYYTYASSLASGQGYCDLSAPGSPATNGFPPGYPLLMTPLRMMTDSFVAQKWLNEVFVLLALVLLYFGLMRAGLPMVISFTAAVSGAFLPRLFHFSTMMMSEASFLLTSVVVLYCLIRMAEHEEDYLSELRHPWLYLMIVAVVLNYHIRTQGLAMIAGVLLALLIRKRWVATGVTIVGFVIGAMPWKLRNAALGLNGNRYIDAMMQANPWRPEEGTLTVAEIIHRFFDTLQMLLFQAIPNTVFPFFSTNPDQPEYSFGIYLTGALLVALMIFGCWHTGKLRWALLAYIAATLGLISLFSTPSGSRYITTILPLLSAVEFIGLWKLVTLIPKRPQWLDTVAALALLLILFTCKAGMEDEHKMSQQRFPKQYKQFFAIGEQVKKKTPAGTLVCSRKPQMFYLYSDRPGVVYKFTQDPQELLDDLVKKNVDYVILDALGYSSTPYYLFPAIQKYPQYFAPVIHYEDTHTYLLKFRRDAYQQSAQ
ncbi:MAG: phospholipid carrier-dependent glycosyltransferase [Paludibacteraceae bacterium]|nr:phospholipid carrier-dependent glycosyltransferase [Paludibacteraceae bacterium]